MKPKKTHFVIQDWAGNVMNWGTFPTFADAWQAVYERFDNEEDYQEYYAVEVSQ